MLVSLSASAVRDDLHGGDIDDPVVGVAVWELVLLFLDMRLSGDGGPMAEEPVSSGNRVSKPNKAAKRAPPLPELASVSLFASFDVLEPLPSVSATSLVPFELDLVLSVSRFFTR